MVNRSMPAARNSNLWSTKDHLDCSNFLTPADFFPSRKFTISTKMTSLKTMSCFWTLETPLVNISFLGVHPVFFVKLDFEIAVDQ